MAWGNVREAKISLSIRTNKQKKIPEFYPLIFVTCWNLWMVATTIHRTIQGVIFLNQVPTRLSFCLLCRLLSGLQGENASINSE